MSRQQDEETLDSLISFKYNYKAIQHSPDQHISGYKMIFLFASPGALWEALMLSKTMRTFHPPLRTLSTVKMFKL